MLGVDQHGNKYYICDPKSIRKALLKATGRVTAAKMYCDLKDGSTIQTGYVIAPLRHRLWEGSLWITVYVEHEFKARV